MEAGTKTSARVRNLGRRAYLAGGGATAALIAATVLVFGSLGAYVAFEGLPVGGGDAAAGEVTVDQSERAPGNSARLGEEPGGAGAVAGAPGRGADGGLAADPGGGLPAGDSSTATALPGAGSSAGAGSPGPVNPSSGTNPAVAGGEAGNAPSIGAAVGETGGAAGQVAEVPAGELTDDFSGPLDEALDDAVAGASEGRLGPLLDGGRDGGH